MKNLSTNVWIGSEHEIEEAFASPNVSIQQCFVIRRFDSYIKNLLQQYGIKKQINIIDENSMNSMSKQKGMKYWVQVSLNIMEDIEDFVEKYSTPKLVLILDQIQDPQNLGALIRSAHFFGVEMVLMPKDHTSPVTEAVSRASAGAIFFSSIDPMHQLGS